MRLRPDRRLVSTAFGLAAFGAVTFTACGGDGAAAPTREYTIHLRAEEQGDTYKYIAEDPLDLRVGDRVTIEMRNAGALAHDLQVVHPDGQPIATGAATAPGGTLSVVVDFEDPGVYRLNCNVDNHLTEHGMQAFIEVTEAGA